ncbi:phosphatidylinositol phosphate synthase [Georgenia thermotolerans]|uniref:Phosphatidylinositol phosphate synthase n=1 Tax=Georgenia thermotolerans TaxID=527326 RepID=A0A7J5UKE7_9MICO|nr:CDP-alcohol phosphatidyltransferase family protein [Georgenia thermotolerans]KAE8762827.1 CDP-alcohol phosphatidyltransferase family protein [Georgenia thermotolerans]
MLSRSGRGFAAAVFGPAARVLVRLGVSPDVVTVGGTAATTVAALTLLPTDHLTAGALVVGALVVADNLDGQMARMMDRVSRWGAFLDSTMDRIADAALFSGLLLWALHHVEGPLGGWTAALALACLVLGGVVPYAKARAEGLGMTANVGLAERADRLVVALVATLLVGLGLPVWVMTVALGLLALASAVTVVQRMRTVYLQARAAGPGSAADGQDSAPTPEGAAS